MLAAHSGGEDGGGENHSHVRERRRALSSSNAPLQDGKKISKKENIDTLCFLWFCRGHKCSQILEISPDLCSHEISAESVASVIEVSQTILEDTNSSW